MNQPFPPPPAPEQPRPAATHNGFGTAGFVLGLLGLLFSVLPIVGVVAWPLVILGIIFAAIGLHRVAKGRATNKALTIAGLVLSVIGLVICILWTAVFTRAANDLNNEANRQVTVHYEVTGNAKDATVTYSTVGDNGAGTNQEQVSSLPWTKDVQTKGLIKGGTLTVGTGADGGNVNCNVVVDGKQTKTASASGPFASASCDGF